MPASLTVERSSDVLVVICKKSGFNTVAHAYTFKSNPYSTYGNLLDPTWVVGDYLDERTGVAFQYSDEIIIPLHK